MTTSRTVFVLKKRRCPVCGQDTKGRTYTGPAGHTVVIRRRRMDAATVCLECFIAAHLPPGYERRERYVQNNATRRPATGVAWLDEGLRRVRSAPAFVFYGEMPLEAMAPQRRL
jgi:hypothetical protein